MTLSERLREWGIPIAIKAANELDRLYALRDQSDKDQAIYEEKIDRLTARITAIMEQLPHPHSLPTVRVPREPTDNNPKSDRNWAMLDTIATRALLNQKD